MSGFNTPYIRGNMLNRDHVYWPMLTRTELQPIVTAESPGFLVSTFWPVDINVNQICALAWRVKKWRYSGSIDILTSGHPTAGPPLPTHFNHFTSTVQPTSLELHFSGIINPYDPFPTTGAIDKEPLLIGTPKGPHAIVSPPVYETDLQLKNTPTLRNNAVGFLDQVFTGIIEHRTMTDTFWGTNFNATGDFSGGTSIFKNFRGVDVVTYDTSHGPYFPFREGMIQNIDVGCFNLPIVETSNVTMTVDTGIAGLILVPLFGRAQNWSLMTIESVTVSGSYALDAVEFYEYRNSLDQPVYDSVTGAQINDPFA